MGSNIKIINKNEGEYLGIAGGNYRIIISGEQTSGNYAVIEMTVPPGVAHHRTLIPIYKKCSMYWRVK